MNYLSLINKYGSSLSDYQKPIARRLFKNLIKKGWSYDQIYWGIRLLKGRPIEKNIGLFYYKDFVEEIQQKVLEAQEEIYVPFEQKIIKLDMLVGFGFDSVPQEYKNDLLLLDDKLFNSDSMYSKDELENDVNHLYEKCYLIPLFELPLEDIE